MVKVINITESDWNNLFTKKHRKFLSSCWAHYLYCQDYYIRLLPEDITDEQVELISKTLDETHIDNKRVWIYRISH